MQWPCCRLEQSTGLAFRFVIGRTKDVKKMEELKREEEKYHDFLFIDVEEQYLRLPYKTYELKSSVCPSLYDFLSNHRPYSAYFPPPNLSGWHSLKPHLIYLRQNIILKPTMTSTCVLVSSSFS